MLSFAIVCDPYIVLHRNYFNRFVLLSFWYYAVSVVSCFNVFMPCDLNYVFNFSFDFRFRLVIIMFKVFSLCNSKVDHVTPHNFQQVGRSLFCLGLLIRYGNSLLSTASTDHRSLEVVNSLGLFKKYLSTEDFVIKIRSLQVILHLSFLSKFDLDMIFAHVASYVCRH